MPADDIAFHDDLQYGETEEGHLCAALSTALIPNGQTTLSKQSLQHAVS